MEKSKNKYYYPVDLNAIIRASHVESPAHVGRLVGAVDFVVPEETIVKAALSGIVVDIKQDSDVGGPEESFDQLGNFIEIKHRNNEYSIYEHIQKGGSLVNVGDKVKTGQAIALSGATGWLAHLGPHLHFDVHKYFGMGREDYAAVEIVWAEKKK